MDKQNKLYVEQERPRPIVPMAVWGGLKYEVLGHVFADGNGKILSHEDAYTLIQSIRKGYENFTPQQVTENNQEVDREIEALQASDPPTRYRTSKRPAHVYLMCSEDMFKIGVTQDPERRRLEIQRASGLDVEIIDSVYVPDPYTRERELHDQHSHSRRRGEWFVLTNQEVRNIMNIFSQWDKECNP